MKFTVRFHGKVNARVGNGYVICKGEILNNKKWQVLNHKKDTKQQQKNKLMPSRSETYETSNKLDNKTCQTDFTYSNISQN